MKRAFISHNMHFPFNGWFKTDILFKMSKQDLPTYLYKVLLCSLYYKPETKLSWSSWND